MKQVFISVICATLLAACSSSPDWGNMSQSEINDWKSAGFNSKQAENWQELGVKALEAKNWKDAGFNIDNAEDWIEENFTAEEAKTWKTAGFSISEAKKDRAKGLQPITNK